MNSQATSVTDWMGRRLRLVWSICGKLVAQLFGSFATVSPQYRTFVGGIAWNIRGGRCPLHWSPKIRIPAPIYPFTPRRLRRNGAARNCWRVADDDGSDDGHFLRFPLRGANNGTCRGIHNVIVCAR